MPGLTFRHRDGTMATKECHLDTLGRDDELRQLHAFLDRPVEGLTALVLTGEAGIGKSTLWLAGVAAACERGLLPKPKSND
jgi:ATP-dependent Clp protease ATP-binding subunit ClpA